MISATATLILTNGRFLTMEEEATAEAVAIAGKRILYVGSDAGARAFQTEQTRVIDLGGRLASPGLIDCHTHPIASYAPLFIMIDFRGAATSSLKKFLSIIEEKAKTLPKGAWILGRGYDESKFSEGSTPPTAAMLDELTTEHPVFIRRTCGHVAVLNSLAMKLSGFTEDMEPPIGGGHCFRDENGRLNGLVSGALLRKVPAPPITADQRKKALIEGVQKEYFKNGVTSTAEMGGSGEYYRAYQELDQEKKLKLRVGLFFSGRRVTEKSMSQSVSKMGFVTGFGSDHFRFLGMKFVMDGSTGGRTAAFSLPYADNSNNFGELYNNQDHLNEDILTCAKANLMVSIHAIGDRAIENALKSIEYANEHGVDTRPLRFRLEHLESPTPDHIRRMKELGIGAGLSSAFIYSLGDSHLEALGYDRLVDAFPAKTLMEKGIPVGCNSDCPICPINPMLGIYSMVTRTTEKGQSFGGKKEAVDRMSALLSYTKNAAWLIRNEENVGTLKAGKFADIAVFDEDLFTVPDEKIKDVSIYMTLSDGEIVYQK